MEFASDNDKRGGHPTENNGGGERARQMPMNGFEGMNYEQRREDYRPRRQDVGANGKNRRDDGREGDRNSNV